ncbi:uncharacterized protein LOC131931943 [Physella acuta]|uniref:uncharacterized protein LOC131931943 n=1 Tax=Physella acuta TaxID=109671 RepID=UPI0027DAE29B|nr:uncharacterized protein LOC131931943 [Physella acuta]XP_059144761.1 uncharacterized protein LOC131931943 [Physella acuta]
MEESNSYSRNVEETDIAGQSTADVIAISMPDDQQALGIINKEQNQPLELNETHVGLPNKQENIITENAALINSYQSLDVYNLEFEKTGIAIIFNIRKKPAENTSDLRKGSVEDVKNLEAAFEKIGMTVYRVKKENKTADGIVEFLNENVSTGKFKQYAMVVCVFMSHGCPNGFHSSNGIPIEPQFIIEKFSNNPYLKNKPKMFIFQACRGSINNTIPYAASHIKPSDDTDLPEVGPKPKLADCLIIQSTIAGYASKRNPDSGSWFITEFCKVLTDNWEMDEMCTLLTRVNEAVSKIGLTTDPEKHEITKQMSTYTSMLTRKLYLCKDNLQITDYDRLQGSQSLESYRLGAGKIIIINIDEFFDGDKVVLKRENSAEDVKCLEDVFIGDMKMKLMPYHAKTTAGKILGFLDKSAREDYTNDAIFVCVIMSYGNGVELHASKNELGVNMEKVVHMFDQSTSLQGKPKLFIFQDSRHAYFKTITSSAATTNRSDNHPDSSLLTEPHLADCLIVRSSPPAYLSQDNQQYESTFIAELCKVFKTYWQQEEICTMLTRVNSIMCFKDQNESETLSSSFKSMLRKRLFFSEKCIEAGKAKQSVKNRLEKSGSNVCCQNEYFPTEIK